MTRRQLRDLERAEREFVPIVTASVAVAQPVPDAVVTVVPAAAEPIIAQPVVAEPIVAEAVVAAPVVAAPVPLAPAAAAPLIAGDSYARLLESIAPTVPLTRAEARRRRDAASLDTVALDISTIIADSSMVAAASPAVEAPVTVEALSDEDVALAESIVAEASAAREERAAEELAPEEQGAVTVEAEAMPEATALPVVDATAPVTTLPRSTRTLAASAITAEKPGAPAAAPRASIRRVTAKIFSGTVMTIVALMAVATSLPADALLTAEDVQAAQQFALQQSTPGSDEPIQSVEVAAGTDSITIARDGYETSTVADVAAASGIRMEATFTNNPNGTVQWPFAVGVHIGDQFGYRDCAGCSSNHGGQDFNPGDGAPIQSIADGVVALAEDGEGSLGVHMIIEHVINGQTVASVYAHMQHGTMQFATGDVVKVGQIIGNTGTTGMSTGPHLHFEIRQGGMNGTKIDPLQWLYANTN